MRYTQQEKQMIAAFWMWLNSTKFKTSSKDRNGRRQIKLRLTDFANDFGISRWTLARTIKEMLPDQ